MANNLWDTSVPQATARLNDDETVRPSNHLPELDSFRQLAQLRAQSLQHRASGAPSVSPAFARIASGGLLSSPLESGLTTGQLEALPTDFQGLATGMASHQAANADRLSQLREDRRLRAVQRLAAERSAREPADWLMEDASRVGSATVASSSNQGPTCAICQDTVADGEELVILRCAHMYHAQCMDLWVAQGVADEIEATCPQCRGDIAGNVRQRYSPSGPQAFAIGTPPQTPRSSFQSVASASVPASPGVPEQPESSMPWWPTDGAHPTEAFEYHAATQLTGKCSVIVDSGAWTNLIGEKLARELAKKAIAAGMRPKQTKMDNPLSIQGVGNGSQKCDWEMHCPIAVPQVGDETKRHTFTAPVVQGTGKDLPGLLGLRSLEQQRAILDTGSRTLIFPGPGDVEISLPPGSVRVPLEKAPSGHLVMVIDEYHKLISQTGGVPSRVTHLLSEPAGPPANDSAGAPANNQTARRHPPVQPPLSRKTRITGQMTSTRPAAATSIVEGGAGRLASLARPRADRGHRIRTHSLHNPLPILAPAAKFRKLLLPNLPAYRKRLGRPRSQPTLGQPRWHNPLPENRSGQLRLPL